MSLPFCVEVSQHDADLNATLDVKYKKPAADKTIDTEFQAERQKFLQVE